MCLKAQVVCTHIAQAIRLAWVSQLHISMALIRTMSKAFCFSFCSTFCSTLCDVSAGLLCTLSYVVDGEVLLSCRVSVSEQEVRALISQQIRSIAEYVSAGASISNPAFLAGAEVPNRRCFVGLLVNSAGFEAWWQQAVKAHCHGGDLCGDSAGKACMASSALPFVPRQSIGPKQSGGCDVDVTSLRPASSWRQPCHLTSACLWVHAHFCKPWPTAHRLETVSYL